MLFLTFLSLSNFSLKFPISSDQISDLCDTFTSSLILNISIPTTIIVLLSIPSSFSLHNIHQAQAKADQPKIRQILPSHSLGELAPHPSKERIRPQKPCVHTRREQRRWDRNAHQRRRVSPGNRESNADSRGQRDQKPDNQIVGVATIHHLHRRPARPDIPAGMQCERASKPTDDEPGEELKEKLEKRGIRRRRFRWFLKEGTFAEDANRGRWSLCVSPFIEKNRRQCREWGPWEGKPAWKRRRPRSCSIPNPSQRSFRRKPAKEDSRNCT